MKITVTLHSDYVEAVQGHTLQQRGIEAQAIDAVAYDPDAGVFTVRTDAFDHRWTVGTKAQFVLKEHFVMARKKEPMGMGRTRSDQRLHFVAARPTMECTKVMAVGKLQYARRSRRAIKAALKYAENNAAPCLRRTVMPFAD